MAPTAATSCQKHSPVRESPVFVNFYCTACGAAFLVPGYPSLSLFDLEAHERSQRQLERQFLSNVCSGARSVRTALVCTCVARPARGKRTGSSGAVERVGVYQQCQYLRVSRLCDVLLSAIRTSEARWQVIYLRPHPHVFDLILFAHSVCPLVRFIDLVPAGHPTG